MENTVNAVVEEVVTPQNEQAVAEVETEVVEHAESEVVTDTQKEVEKPVQSPEENAKYAEIRRKYEAEKAEAEKKAQDALIAKMYGESHGIRTVEEYEAAMAKQKEMQEIETIKSERNYTEEEAREILEARRIKQEREAEVKLRETEQQQKQRQEKENLEFLEFFKDETGRDFDVNADKIPDEVWKNVANGTPLKYAYMQHELKQLKLGAKASEKNEENAKASIGSVKGDGVIDSDYISEALFESKKDDQRWVIKNLDKITKSRETW